MLQEHGRDGPNEAWETNIYNNNTPGQNNQIRFNWIPRGEVTWIG